MRVTILGKSDCKFFLNKCECGGHEFDAFEVVKITSLVKLHIEKDVYYFCKGCDRHFTESTRTKSFKYQNGNLIGEPSKKREGNGFIKALMVFGEEQAVLGAIEKKFPGFIKTKSS